MTIKRFCYQKMRVFNVLTLILLASALLSCGPAGRSFWLEEPMGVKYSVNVDGFWSDWWREDFRNYGISKHGPAVFFVYPAGELPSNYFLKVQIDYYNSKDEDFDGWVEYYVSETYPTIKSVFTNAYKYKGLRIFPRPSSQWSENTVKRRAKASIKVLKRYRNNPTVINCWFDNVGLAMDISMVAWK